MAQVRGHVFYKDGSVPKGAVAVIRFEPAQDSDAEVRKAATGSIESDGSFQMMTRKPGDGVFLGKYNVTFAVLRDAMNPRSSMINPKYTVSSTSGYQVTVDGNKDDLKYEIEGAGGAAERAPK